MNRTAAERAALLANLTALRANASATFAAFHAIEDVGAEWHAARKLANASAWKGSAPTAGLKWRSSATCSAVTRIPFGRLGATCTRGNRSYFHAACWTVERRVLSGLGGRQGSSSRHTGDTMLSAFHAILNGASTVSICGESYKLIGRHVHYENGATYFLARSSDGSGWSMNEWELDRHLRFIGW
jgi:hypothetical protein